MIPLVTSPFYSFDFDSRHRFPMEKFGLLTQILSANKILTQSNTFRPGKAKDDILQLAHCPDYVSRFITNQLSRQELRRMGLPWSAGLVKRSLISPNGTLITASLALEYGIACHLAGGTHHAHRDFASGFCIFNDLAVASLALVEKGYAASILIFDCDVHQGDGTASILQDESRIFTCSIHCEKNFPARKTHSDLDIGLAQGTTDRAYLAKVTSVFEALLSRLKPDLVIYDAGVDVYSEDPLGLLNISEQGIRQRDHAVISLCKERNIPIATVIGGGYDNDRVALAKRHAIVVEQAHTLFTKSATDNVRERGSQVYGSG